MLSKTRNALQNDTNRCPLFTDGASCGDGLNVKFTDMNITQCVFCVCQELDCLQDHLEDLVPNCRDVVGNLTELESEVQKYAFVMFYCCFALKLRSLSFYISLLLFSAGRETSAVGLD